MVKPRAKRPVVDYLKLTYQFSERRACALLQLNRSSHRYHAKASNDGRLKTRLKELATQYPVYGYLLLHGLLKQEGLVVNKKRTYRLYSEANLQVRTKRRKRLQRPRLPMLMPTKVNERWSMDFVSDQLSNGRRFRILNVVDDYSRECIGQYVDLSISGETVGRILNMLVSERSKPQSIVCDNGSEFTSKAMFFWAKKSGVKLAFIQPGKPTQNAFVESFNGKFRASCLNQNWFRTLDEARDEIDMWKEHYNHVRPHSSLNYMPPSLFAKEAA